MKLHLFAFPVLVVGSLLLGAACTVSTGGGSCTDDAECASDEACSAGVCVADGPAASVALGGECVDDSECDVGDACDDTGVCVADTFTSGSEDVGADCFEDADCSSGICDEDTDTCM